MEKGFACLVREIFGTLVIHVVLLVACPAAVCVEVSRDGSTSFPVCAPVHTSGLTLIKVQLLKAEVASSVTIRLHKPRDSTTIGLSQILLLGMTVFSSSGSRNSSITGQEDYVPKTRYTFWRSSHVLSVNQTNLSSLLTPEDKTTQVHLKS